MAGSTTTEIHRLCAEKNCWGFACNVYIILNYLVYIIILYLLIVKSKNENCFPNKRDFTDGICSRYGWKIRDMPSLCGCGKDNSYDHALSCLILQILSILITKFN